MKVGHLEEVEISGKKIGRLTIYSGEPEEYSTRISSEAVEDLHMYLEKRKRSGEVITKNSWMVRADFNENFPAPRVRTANETAIQIYFRRKWKEAGVTSRKWKVTHCFRSYGETVMQREAKDIFLSRN